MDMIFNHCGSENYLFKDKGINPQTKEKIQIPARKVVKFKPAAELAK